MQPSPGTTVALRGKKPLAGSALNPNWSRINIHLPVNNSAETIAARLAVNALRGEYTEITVSDLDFPIFEYYQEHPVTQYLVRDLIAVASIDIPVSVDDPIIPDEVSRCQLLVEEAYYNTGCTQDFIPVTLHALSVLT
jgi:hypothetical protein